MSSESPPRSTISSAPFQAQGQPSKSSILNLATQLQDVHLSHNSGFAGRFRYPVSPPPTEKYGTLVAEKPLPPTPIFNIPDSLRPAYVQRRNQVSSLYHHEPSIQMPIPVVRPIPPPTNGQSLTMTFARSAPPPVNHHLAAPFIQQSTSAPTTPFPARQRPRRVLNNNTVVSPPLASPAHKRSVSTPSSPLLSSSGSSNNAVQCSGTTKAGKRCTRNVKAAPLVSIFAPESCEPIERFCFQHAKEIMDPSGFYSHRENVGWVEFSDWIPSYLHPDTQAALRVEMEKPASDKDESGYIYAFEIRDDTSNEIRLKVGRAVKLVKRLDEWAKQCSSKEIILRGWWPGTVEDQDTPNGRASLLRGTVKAGDPGLLCHRLERLVHLELADLAVHAPYLKDGFPKENISDDSPASTPASSPKKPSKAKTNIGRPCPDCGQMHREIFAFQRARKGRYKNAEWEKLVRPVISKWGNFVRDFV